MTQDKKIWHTGDMPESNRPYLHYKESRQNGANGWYAGMYNGSSKSRLASLREGKYAYIDDLIASSKALDVAIDALKRLRDVPDEDNDQWFNYCCPRCVLQEINEIMKGGK